MYPKIARIPDHQKPIMYLMHTAVRSGVCAVQRLKSRVIALINTFVTISPSNVVDFLTDDGERERDRGRKGNCRGNHGTTE